MTKVIRACKDTKFPGKICWICKKCVIFVPIYCNVNMEPPSQVKSNQVTVVGSDDPLLRLYI